MNNSDITNFAFEISHFSSRARTCFSLPVAYSNDFSHCFSCFSESSSFSKSKILIRDRIWWFAVEMVQNLKRKYFFYIYSYFRLILVKKSATHKTEKRGETDESKRLSLHYTPPLNTVVGSRADSNYCTHG